jgi:hypothetical protein
VIGFVDADVRLIAVYPGGALRQWDAASGDPLPTRRVPRATAGAIGRPSDGGGGYVLLALRSGAVVVVAPPSVRPASLLAAGRIAAPITSIAENPDAPDARSGFDDFCTQNPGNCPPAPPPPRAFQLAAGTRHGVVLLDAAKRRLTTVTGPSVRALAFLTPRFLIAGPGGVATISSHLPRALRPVGPPASAIAATHDGIVVGYDDGSVSIRQTGRSPARSAGRARRNGIGPPVDDPVVAFAVGDTLEVADRDGRRQIVGQAPPSQDGSRPTARFVWSPGGALGWTDGETAHVLRGGRVRSWDCPCTSVAFAGETLEAIESDARALLRLRGATPERRALHGLPGPGTELVAATGHGAVAVGNPTSSFGPIESRVYVIDRRGTAHDRGVTNEFVGPVLVSPHQSRVALVLNAFGGVCDEDNSVAVVDVRSGRITYPQLPQRTADNLFVLSLSWPAGGPLAAAVGQVACAHPYAAKAQLLTLGAGPAVARGRPRRADIQAGREVTSAVFRLVTYGTEGTLRLTRDDGTHVVVARGVSDMLVRP